MIRRVLTFFQRLGFVQSLIYLLVLGYMLWHYSQMWRFADGRIFVASVMGIGIGVGSALAPLMFRNYLLAHSIVSKSGLALMVFWLLVYRVPIQLPFLGYWALHTALWLQVTLNFWISSHDPISYELRRMSRQARRDAETTVDDEDGYASALANARRTDDPDDDNWYRRD